MMSEPVSRRSFLGKAAPVTATAGFSYSGIRAAFAQSVMPLTTWRGWNVDDGFWDKVRREFRIEEGLAYMNTGTVGATPGPVLEAMQGYWRMMAENPNENSAILQSRQEGISAIAAQFIGATPGEVAILRNATEGNSLLCHGVDLKAGDEVVIGTLEHDSNRQPWLLKAKRYGIILKEAHVGTPPKSPQEIIDSFAAAISPRTRIVSFAHCDTVTGTFTPVKQIAELAHAKGALCFVDGAQALGVVDVNVRELGVDAYATTCHKWLASPAGTGLLYIRRDVQDRVWPNIVTENWWTFQDARKYDRISRRPWPVVAALGDSLDFQLAIGKQRIEQRVRSLSTYLRGQLAEIQHVVLYTSNEPALAAGITSLALDNVPADRAREYLRQRYEVYTAARAKGQRYPADPHGVTGFRVSTHFYNTFEQVDRILAGVRDLANGKS
jgi:selenocysteine lyase/cysteine desulfurase